MQHPLPGLANATAAHVSQARIFTRAVSDQPLSYHEKAGRSIDALLGPFQRARKSLMLLRDVIADIKTAQDILEGRQPDTPPAMIWFMAAMATDAQHASTTSKQSIGIELKMLMDEMNKAADAQTLDLAEAWSNARLAICKAATVGGIDLNSLLLNDQDGLNLIVGSDLMKALPESFTHGWEPLTKDTADMIQKRMLAGYTRHLEGEALFADEMKAAELRLASKAQRKQLIESLSKLASEAAQ